NRTDVYLLDRLADMGHQIEVINKPYADMFGHAGMLIRDAKGAIMADHDPRSDGGAEGL
ncbi:MAG: gamma-glutamyltransferase, partial [Methylobacterium sp.]|nr:gamma-glutamyltransferase [Methylobacterium sp.]